MHLSINLCKRTVDNYGIEKKEIGIMKKKNTLGYENKPFGTKSLQ